MFLSFAKIMKILGDRLELLPSVVSTINLQIVCRHNYTSDLAE